MVIAVFIPKVALFSCPASWLDDPFSDLRSGKLVLTGNIDQALWHSALVFNMPETKVTKCKHHSREEEQRVIKEMQQQRQEEEGEEEETIKIREGESQES